MNLRVISAEGERFQETLRWLHLLQKKQILLPLLLSADLMPFSCS